MPGPIQPSQSTPPNPAPHVAPPTGPGHAPGAGGNGAPPQGNQLTIPSATPGYEQQYTVRKDDTLSAIADRHKIKLSELLAANPQFDPNSAGNGINFQRGAPGTWDADAIFVGDQIQLPPSAQAPGSNPAPAPAPSPSPAPTPTPSPTPSPAGEARRDKAAPRRAINAGAMNLAGSNRIALGETVERRQQNS